MKYIAGLFLFAVVLFPAPRVQADRHYHQAGGGNCVEWPHDGPPPSSDCAVYGCCYSVAYDCAEVCWDTPDNPQACTPGAPGYGQPACSSGGLVGQCDYLQCIDGPVEPGVDNPPQCP